MDRKLFFAVKALVFYNDTFLIVQRSDAARGEHHLWEFPGGRLEFGESPEEALARELMEETGLFAKLLCPLQTWSFFRDNDTQIVGVTFLCNATTDAVQLSDEHEAYAWIRYDEITQYNIVPTVLSDLEQLDMDEIGAKLNRS